MLSRILILGVVVTVLIISGCRTTQTAHRPATTCNTPVAAPCPTPVAAPAPCPTGAPCPTAVPVPPPPAPIR